MKDTRRQFAVACLLGLSILLPPASTQAETPLPHPPCAPGESAYPAYAPLSAPPRAEVWQNIELGAESACRGRLKGELGVVATLSARFRFDGTLDDLAARAGAISETVGLTYWSVSEQKWRNLVTAASAVTGPDGDWSHGHKWRADFTAAEVRSGEQLWVMQNDTRSTGANLYRLRALESDADHLVLEVVNESPIKFTFVSLFDEHELLSLHVIERLEGDVWGYYGLAAVRGKQIKDYEKSLVNRTAAFFRFLQGKAGDSEPPLAK